MKLKLTIIAFVCFSIALTSCNSKEEKKVTNDTDSVAAPPVEVKKVPVQAAVRKDSVLRALTTEILTYVKNKDLNKFADYIHPDGVRFSPYGYINTANDVKLSKQEFIAKLKSIDKLPWGNYDGSGEPIKLTVIQYFDKFVYNADFLNAEKFSVNKVLGKGNSKNNLEEVYKGCDYTESYFPGFDKKYEGMDWCALRLIFKKHEGKYYLVGTVHDQWTT